MVDKNGVEMHVGDVVKVTGGYYASNNGLWIIDEEPGVGSWRDDNYHMLMATLLSAVANIMECFGLLWFSITVILSVKLQKLIMRNMQRLRLSVKLMLQ